MSVMDLKRNLKFFNATRNPIYAWWAYKRARQENRPIPEEVLAYLDKIADTVVGLAAGQKADPKKRPLDIAKGMGLGTSQPFTHYKRDRRYVRFLSLAENSLCEWIDKYDTGRGWANSELEDIAKQAGIGKTTADGLVKKHFKNKKAIAEETAEAYLSTTSKE